MAELDRIEAITRAAGARALDWSRRLSAADIVAAGVLMVREAGGRVTDLDGADRVLPSGAIAASNGRVHAEFLDLAARHGPWHALRN